MIYLKIGLNPLVNTPDIINLDLNSEYDQQQKGRDLLKAWY